MAPAYRRNRGVGIIRMVAVRPAGRRTRLSLPWWAEPIATAAALAAFGLYAAWEVLFHASGRYGNYLSPFFSPEIGVRVLPALWVIWVPLLFRGTCYYYRREYYRGFLWDPPACARPEPPRHYTGESRLPLSLNNLHRFFLYLALAVLAVLWKDALQSLWFAGRPGVGLGSVLLLVNAALLSAYTLSCHAFRHLVGGRHDCLSCGRARSSVRQGLWRRVSAWNARHGRWAWVSMFWVWGTDLYIRLLIGGVLHDPRILL